MDQKLLDILICPVSNDSLILVGEELFSKKGMLAYPIRDGIPVMLENEARKLSEEDIKDI
ncbi:MAG: Trm112 family protein [Gammaproteobacteria bacterium]|nr:Trm112 family protein [SAR86 cluster bacterium]